LAPSRAAVLKVGEVFERNADAVRVTRPPKEEQTAPEPQPWEERVTVFVGHGREPAWRELSDRLEKQHHIHTEAFEFAANAGHATRSILERLLEESSFAALVMTAEDETVLGEWRARENVVHEVGLFQGKLGFDRAIVLLEEGCEEFSNIHGIQQIRFASGHIGGSVGEILATLRREFG
jgi:predicted nucleotide-binding protein